MAVATGVAVANIYYNQPILKDIAASFHITEARVSNVALLSQVGYGLGLFFIVPLGDKMNKKRLIIVLLSLLSITLALMCFSTSPVQVLACSFAIGLFAVSPQVIIPLAASLDKASRGRTIGIIYTGLLVGILAARVFSGFVSAHLGWRYVYGISMCLVLMLALLLQLYLPNVKQDYEGNYIGLLRSTVYQFKRFPLLRSASIMGGVAFGVFSSFWTTLTFHLSGAPFYFRSDIIGLFGLVAIAGAMMAPIFGKRVDKGGARQSLIITVSILMGSVLLLKIFPYSITSLVVAVLLLDVGVQATHVTNVARIYSLDDTSLSRINTVYLTIYFLGGAIGTFVGAQCWKWGGWGLVTWQMLLWCAIAMIIVLTANRIHK